MLTQKQKIISNVRFFLNNKNTDMNTYQNAKEKSEFSEKELSSFYDGISKLTSFDFAEILGVALCDINMIESIITSKNEDIYDIDKPIYNMAINSCARQIVLDADLNNKLSRLKTAKNIKKTKDLIANHNAFKFSQILSIALRVDVETICYDLISVHNSIDKLDPLNAA